MKSYLINPEDQTITLADYRGYESIKELIKAPLFDVVRINDLGDCIYVDDEGLYRQPQYFWTYGNYLHPLAGRGLVLGTDMSTGESRPPMRVSISTLTEMITFITPQEALKKAMEADRQIKQNLGPHDIHVSTTDIMLDREYTETSD